MHIRPITAQVSLVTCLLLLCGCSTFILIGKDMRVQRTDDTQQCQIYVRPEHSDIPPLPVIDNNRVYTDQELAYLQAEHIRKLREWIAAERQREDEVYREYARHCNL